MLPDKQLFVSCAFIFFHYISEMPEDINKLFPYNSLMRDAPTN
jgi:hypothetical protein